MNGKLLGVVVVLCITISCSQKEKTSLFQLLPTTETGIKFNNSLAYTEDFNPYLYRNFYNGGGVALGDINNDGLLDIYFTGNLVDNKLYLNKGNWKFEDITKSAKVTCSNVWSTGATFADINGDGYLDLYVCKSGKPGGKNRNNELFINNGDLTFTEKSKEYGLNITGLSVHSAFFDFDKDGDLDCYLLNNSIKSIGGFDLIKDQRRIPSPNGNKLLENRNGVFEDVSLSHGIFSSSIGFGLGITLSDFNNDNWPDLFISNDFFEKDYLYLNQQGKQFKESSDVVFSSISMGSMGADAGDLNNDLLAEVMVTEMLPTTLSRKKTKAIYESWDKYTLANKKGYGNQFPRNVLQQNMGKNTFFEVSRITGLDATEWSWSTLFFDMDNNGLKDVLITNGINKDLLDRDYLNYMSDSRTVKKLILNNTKAITKMLDQMPSKAIPNAAFINQGNFNFIEQSDSLGLGTPSFSNGSVYGDLDNDGDLDLVVNNVNMPSFIYENTANQSNNNYIKIRFKGNDKNTKGIGCKVYAFYNQGKKILYENFNSHGFQSATAPELLVGLGQTKKIDSLAIIWPNDRVSFYKNMLTDTTITVLQNEAEVRPLHFNPKAVTKFEKISPLFNFKHIENKTIDFKKEQLLDRMTSNEGPALDLADINEDGKKDFFVGGAKNQSAKLFLSSDLAYDTINTPFKNDKISEDTSAKFFDSDNDGDLDLYVCSGGKAFSRFDPSLHDRLYINQGKGIFIKSTIVLPFTKTISSSTVSVADYDNDGDIDVFVGERYNPEAYGAPSSGYILKNLGNNQFQIDQQPALEKLGLITSSSWSDLNGDSYPDLIVAGEWMPISIFINNQGKLENKTTEYNLQLTNGIWSSLKVIDIDQDGDLDIFAGNIGKNYVYKRGTTLFFNDFDQNGKLEAILCQKISNRFYPMLDKDELVSQLPHLKKKLLYYRDYANADLAMILDATTYNQSYKYELQTTETSLFINDKGQFNLVKLPRELQYSIVYTIETADLNEDGNMDVLFGGNQDQIKPQFGKLDASKGWVLFGSKDVHDFSQAKPEIMGIDGQIRGFKVFPRKNKKVIITAINNSEVDFYEYNK